MAIKRQNHTDKFGNPQLWAYTNIRDYHVRLDAGTVEYIATDFASENERRAGAPGLRKTFIVDIPGSGLPANMRRFLYANLKKQPAYTAAVDDLEDK